MSKLKEIQARHELVEPIPANYWDRRDWWRGNWNTGLQAHDDRGALIDMVRELREDYGRLQNDNQKYIDKRITAESRNTELEAQLVLLKDYTHHKVGCKWVGIPVARINEFEVIRQPCSCGLHAALKLSEDDES